MKETIVKIQITAVKFFLMCCSYENSCFCLVVIKVNIKAFGNYGTAEFISADILFINILGDIDW